MDVQLKRGLLEVCVLKAIDSTDSYGYQIIKDISPFIEISESTLYPILKRLELSQMLTGGGGEILSDNEYGKRKDSGFFGGLEGNSEDLRVYQ